MNRLSLKPFLPGEIIPSGWLKNELQIQADGLFGNLHRVWPDISDSAWLGGTRSDWERVPYWLDGFIPMAYLLNDEQLIQTARKYINAIIDHQQEDGWIALCSEEERTAYDVWGFFLICKVLTVYADCSGDSEIEKILARALRCLSDHLDRHTLFNWGASRWFEAFIPVNWLYERSQEKWLLDLAHKLEVQGIHYSVLFENYRNQMPESKWSYLTHTVNLAMCLKSEALVSRLFERKYNSFAEKAEKLLLKFHGTAAGHFSGDECVAGTSPIRGTELCSIVEAMYSYETLLSITGEPKWADRLEQLAFNSLPATLSEDLWSHQYDQMINQVQCSIFSENKVPFGTNGPESNLFGLEPNYGCCTANFGQGWSKLAFVTFMRSEEGIVSAVPIPSEIHTKINEASVTCRLDTDYPFKGILKYCIETDREAAFSFSIRIPACAKKAVVDGESAVPGTFYTLNRLWSKNSCIVVQLFFESSFRDRPGGMTCLWRGPLLYALPIGCRIEKREYIQDGIERKFPYCDYELFPCSPWNYSFTDSNFLVEEHELVKQPFSQDNPPVTISTMLVPVCWEIMDGVCAEFPASLSPAGPPEIHRLIPYGCAKLRMTEMPFYNEKYKMPVQGKY